MQNDKRNDEKSTTVSLLCWSLGGNHYALPLEACREVDHGRKIAGVPRSRSHVIGIVNLRGDVVPVMDLRVLLGFQEHAEGADMENVVIRVKTPVHGLALMAGGAADVVSVSSEEIQPPPPHVTDKVRLFTSGVVSTARGLVTILNHDSLLALEQEARRQ